MKKPKVDKPKTNKWEALIRDYASRGEAEKIIWLFRQTQQETLEWCEREIKKLKEKDKGWTGFGVLAVHMGNYEQIQASKDYGYNSAIEDLTKTIKQRKEGNQMKKPFEHFEVKKNYDISYKTIKKLVEKYKDPTFGTYDYDGIAVEVIKLVTKK